MIKTPKIIAFHLPQYHSFPENDEWWGKGFTDWINVKNAKPLFSGHNQPRVPLKKKYYNMMDYKTHKWQAETAQKYGIYGFCYYHYWFNGKLLMEKPMEALLKEKEIALPFCFCWANEPWTRAWDGGEKDIIMPQYYGDKTDWKRHIEYYMPFFIDERYIKVNNKPMLVIYRTSNIDNCDEMITYWDKVCINNGFNGIYVVEELNGFQKSVFQKNSQAYLDFYPWYLSLEKTLGSKRVIDRIRKAWYRIVCRINNPIFFYDSLWRNILMEPYKKENSKEHYLGAIVGWDNTPRKGKQGSICIGSSPKAFGKYFRRLFQKAQENDVDYIFVNAWNEWAEGAYLEPDEKYGYGYLEEIKKAISGESDA